MRPFAALVVALSLGCKPTPMTEAANPFVLELTAIPGGLRASVVNRSASSAAFVHAHPGAACRLTLTDSKGAAALAVESADAEETPADPLAPVVLEPGGRRVLHEERFTGPSREGGWSLRWGREHLSAGRLGLRPGRYRARLEWGGVSSGEVELVVGKP